MDTTILAPAAVLVAWSLVMLGWLAFARFSKLAKIKTSEPPAPGFAARILIRCLALPLGNRTIMRI